MLNFIKNIGPAELIIIGVIIVVFFGSKKLGELGKTAGETTREFKKINKEYSGAVKEVQSTPNVNSDSGNKKGV